MFLGKYASYVNLNFALHLKPFRGFLKQINTRTLALLVTYSHLILQLPIFNLISVCNYTKITGLIVFLSGIQ